MGATIDDGCGPALFVTEQGERPVHEQDRSRLAAEVPGGARRIPPPAREGD
jgi:hypothetical protein